MVRKLLTDSGYLKNRYYRDHRGFSTRVAFHEAFSTNRYGWHRWVYDHLPLGPARRVLEIGCGPGYLWRRNADRLGSQGGIVLSDLSRGMVCEARHHLVSIAVPLYFVVSDMHAIPFPTDAFDIVIANHMLYHARDLGRVLGETRRVLRPTGRLFASTTGARHLAEIRALLGDFKAHAGANGDHSALRLNQLSFTLETARDRLADHFSTLRLLRYDDSLRITDADALVEWVKTLLTRPLADNELAAFQGFVQDRLLTGGALNITKDLGMIEAAPMPFGHSEKVFGLG